MHIILVGATGLAGSRILQEATARSEVTRISVLSRRPSAVQPDAKVHTFLHQDFARYSDELVEQVSTATACIWALGVSSTANVSPEEYSKVTHDWPLAFAQRLSQSTIDRPSPLSFAYLSAIDARSDEKGLLYQREKGRAENDLIKLAISENNCGRNLLSLLLRPGGIFSTGSWLANRKPSFQEQYILQPLYRLLNRLVPSSVISTEALAKSTLDLVLSDEIKMTQASSLTCSNTHLRRLSEGNVSVSALPWQ